MAAISRAVFPPILKTVSLPTWSALENSERNSTKDPILAGSRMRYQCRKPDLASGCLAANSLSRLRVIICIDESLANRRLRHNIYLSNLRVNYIRLDADIQHPVWRL